MTVKWLVRLYLISKGSFDPNLRVSKSDEIYKKVDEQVKVVKKLITSLNH